MRRLALLVAMCTPVMARGMAHAATMSVHLIDPPVIGLSPLTVQVTVTGAAPGDEYQLYLTRSGCPSLTGGFGENASVPAGDSTFESRGVLQEPPPYHGETMNAPGAHTICGYLGQHSYSPAGQYLTTVTASASEVVTAREAVLTLSLGSASYNERRRRLKVKVRGSTEAPARADLYLARAGASCPSTHPPPRVTKPQFVVGHDLEDPGPFVWRAVATKKHGKLRRGRYRICGYLKIERGLTQTSATRGVRVGPARASGVASLLSGSTDAFRPFESLTS
jgi:hypothetical protein